MQAVFSKQEVLWEFKKERTFFQNNGTQDCPAVTFRKKYRTDNHLTMRTTLTLTTMKKVFLTLTGATFFFSCNEMADNHPSKNAVQQIIADDTLQSDIDQIKLVIMYNPPLQNDYKAEHESGVSDTSIYAIDRGVNNGQIFFPCINETRNDYKIAKENILNIISIKYDMTVYDKTDYIFTHDSIFEIHTTTANAGIFMNSDIKIMPNKTPYQKHLKHNANEEQCNFNDYFFNLVLNFCQKNNISTQ